MIVLTVEKIGSIVILPVCLKSFIGKFVLENMYNPL